DPIISAASVREAILALEGTVIADLSIPLPGDLRDIAKAAALVSGVVEDRLPELLNRVRSQTWDEDGTFHAYEFRRMTIGFPDIAPGTPRSLLRTQTVAEMLDASGNRRPESENFGKLERLYDAALQAFKEGVFALVAAGKPLGEWRNFFAAKPKKAVKKAVKA